MNKEIEIPEGYEARIEGNKVILERKESEDEKIRKEMLNSLKEAEDCIVFTPFKKKSWIAYLERQKEQQPVQDEEEREYVRTLKSLIADFLRDKDEVDRGYYQKIYDWLDGRHIEQQPSTAEDIAAAYQMGLAEGRKEQKPVEWSEEDKVMLNNIIWSVHMKSIIKPLYEMDDRSRYKKYEDFLKALPERFNLQPNWKPSEEQMEALMLAIEGKWAEILPTGYMSRRLEDLYEGLANTFKVECKLEE